MSGTGWPGAPAGFLARAQGATVLYVDALLQEAVIARGLGTIGGWNAALATAASASGRAPTAVVAGDGAARWRLKSMRRGGAAAAVAQDRYLSSRRLVATLAASAEARARGVRCPRPVAMLLVRGPWVWTRAFMAFEEVEGAEDLARRAERRGVTRDDVAATMGAVRGMHDLGVVHPDLNLGNVLLKAVPGAAPEAVLVDFDRARCLDRPVPFGLRQAAIRRLERSCAKLTGSSGALGPGSEDLWYTAYAADDAALSARLARGRFAGRMSLAIHRMGWRRTP